MTLSRRSVVEKKGLPEPAPPLGAQEQKTNRVAPSSEFETDILEFERKRVKSAPLSAKLLIEQTPEASTETRTTTSLIYRDAEGRTRRDELAADTGIPETTTINDPVAGFVYVVQHRDRTARRMALRLHAEETQDDALAVMRNSVAEKERAGSYKMLPMQSTSGPDKGLKEKSAVVSPGATKSESLGQREIEGVTADGTSVSVTIPAGAIGNERPLQIVTERWYSPDLKAVVLIERLDPRFGRSVYRLTGLQRSAPAPSLFSVPGDYKIVIE